jgi:hypothetical protein
MEQPEPQYPETARKCLNCGAMLSGPFCSQCGQKDLPKRLTLKELILSFLDSFTSFDSKFFKTFRHLFYPGFLAKEFNAGRRERYYHPARAYVFLSFVFFFLYFSLPDRPAASRNYKIFSGSKDSADYEYKHEGFSLTMDSIHYSSLAEFDSVQQNRSGEQRAGFIERLFVKSMIEYRRNHPKGDESYVQVIGKTFMNNFPKVMFFLLPVFAFWLKILYFTKGMYYSEHLVFSITCYNFYYLLLSLVMLIEFIPGLSWMPLPAGFGLMFYFFIALKRMYQQRWLMTLLKFGIFGIIFSVSSAIALIINFFITLAMI